MFKNIVVVFSIFFSLFVAIQASAQSDSAFPNGRVGAHGEDPQLTIQTGNSHGTFVLGADNSATVGYCAKCQNRNNLNLPSNKDIARPDSHRPDTTSSGGQGSGQQ